MSNLELIYLFEGIAIAFFGVMAVQNLSHRTERLRMILGAVMAYWAVQSVVAVWVTAESDGHDAWLRYLANIFDMTAEPTCCFVLIELCRPGWLTWRKVVYNELSFVALGVAYLCTDALPVYYALLALFVLYGVGIFIAVLIYIPHYNKQIHHNYSYEENVGLGWLYYVLFAFFTMMMTYAICTIQDSIAADIAYIAISLITWGIICYHTSRQEVVIYELKAAATPTESLPESTDNTKADDIGPVLQKKVIDKQLYLRQRLKLSDVAIVIGTNRTYLSRYFNDTLGVSFYDYINKQRLNHAEQLIRTSEYSINTIADMAGFNSYSTFRRVFIDTYGIPPQEYRNKYTDIRK